MKRLIELLDVIMNDDGEKVFVTGRVTNDEYNAISKPDFM